MNDIERYRLVHGPYASPACEIGDQLFCEIRGWVTVRCMSDGLIPWPMMKVRGNRAFILCGDLARAVQEEAAIAVCHWFGVTPQTVTKWRAVLEVPEYSDATRRLHREWMPDRVPPEVHARAIAAANTPEANAKKAAAKIGHEVSEKAAAELARGRRKLREKYQRGSEASAADPAAW